MTVDCTCGADAGGLHSIVCMTVAADQPHAMVDDHGDVYYPDNEDDAAVFIEHHGARWLNGPPEWMP